MTSNMNMKIRAARFIMLLAFPGFLYLTWVNPASTANKDTKSEINLKSGIISAQSIQKDGMENKQEEKKVEAEERKNKAKSSSAGIDPETMQRTGNIVASAIPSPAASGVFVPPANQSKPSKTKKQETAPASADIVSYAGLGKKIKNRISCAAITLHFDGDLQSACMQLGAVQVSHDFAQSKNADKYLVEVNGAKRFYGVILDIRGREPVRLILPAHLQSRIFDLIATRTHELLSKDASTFVTKADVQFDGNGNIVTVAVKTL